MILKCAVKSCQRSDDFLFHSPGDPVKLKAWKILLDVSEDEFFVCSLHFEDRFIETKRVLKAGAYPVSQLPEDVEESCECCTRPMRSNETKYQVEEILQKIMRNLLNFDVSLLIKLKNYE